ncbi:RHS repeat domain-containing protein, partial [Thermodesulfobacteriota bacterium]
GVEIDGSGYEYGHIFQIAKYPIGAYTTIGVGYAFQGFSDEYVQKQMDILQSNLTSTNHDDFRGQIAYLNIVSYYNKVYKSDKHACDLRHLSFYPNQSSYGLSITLNRADTFMGGTIGLEPNHFLTDAALQWTMFPLHDEDVDWNLSKVMGCSDSQLEGFTYRDLYGMPPVSAVTLIQRSKVTGGAIINGWADDDPATDYVIGTGTHYYDWSGWGTIKNDTFDGGYLIHGSLSGHVLHGGATAATFGAKFIPSNLICLRADNPDPSILGTIFSEVPTEIILYYVSGDINGINFNNYDDLDNNSDDEIIMNYNGNENYVEFKVNRLTPIKDPGTSYTISGNFYTILPQYSGNTDTATITFVGQALDADVVFTNFPTEDNTPDANGYVFVSTSDFALESWEFVGGDILQIYKDGIFLETTSIEEIKGMGAGEYTIYYNSGGTPKVITMIVFKYIENESDTANNDISQTAGNPELTRDNEMLFKASISSTYVNKLAGEGLSISSISWKIDLIYADGVPFATLNPTATTNSFEHVWDVTDVDGGLYRYLIAADVTHSDNSTATLYFTDYLYVKGPEKGVLGNLHANIIDSRLVEAGNSFVVWLAPGGEIVIFRNEPDGTYSDTYDAFDLEDAASGYAINFNSGLVINFHPFDALHPGGMIDTIVDKDGNSIIYDYASMTNELIGITDDFDNEILLEDYVNGKITKVSTVTTASETNTSQTSSTSFSYSGDNLTKVTYPDNTSTEYDYDPTTNERTTTRTKDADDNVSSTTTHAYDVTSGKLASTSTPVSGGETTGALVVTGYNTPNATTRVVDFTSPGALMPTRTTWDNNGNVTNTVQPNEIEIINEYAGRNLTKVTTKYHNAVPPIPDKGVSYTYHAHGNMRSMTDAEGKTTYYVYEMIAGIDRLTKELSLGKETVHEYNLTTGNKIKTIDPLNNETNYTYTTTTPKGLLETVSYPSGKSYAYEYNSRGEKIKVIEYTAGVVENTVEYKTLYTATETTKTTTTTPAVGTGYETSQVYDVFGKLLESYDANGNKTGYAYDTLGRKISTFNYYDAENYYETSYTYDNLNRLWTETKAANLPSPDDRKTTYKYFDDGSIDTITDPTGATYSYQYNEMGQVINENDFDGRQTTSGYDKAGRKTSMIKPDAQRIEYGYDIMNRLTKAIYPDSAIDDDYSYNSTTGLLETASNANGTYTFGYDGNHRLTSVIDSFTGMSVGTAYDNLSRVTDLEYPTNRNVKYGFDAAGRQFKIYDAATPSAPYITKGFDDLSRVDTLTFGNGIITTKSFDLASNVLSLHSTGVNATDTMTHTNVYNDLNMRESMINKYNTNEIKQDMQWSYDLLNRVRRVKTKVNSNGQKIGDTIYQYDANSNRTSQRTQRYWNYEEAAHEGDTSIAAPENSVSYAYPTLTNTIDTMDYNLKKEHLTGEESYAAGRQYLDAEDHDDDSTMLTDVGNIVFLHDANGNLTTETDTVGVDSFVTSYEYNSKDQLTQINMPDRTPGVSRVAYVVEYKYDVYGKRREKKLTETSTSNVIIWKQYLYNNEDIIVEYDIVSGGVTEYIHDGGMDNPISMIRGGNTYYYHKDALGSVTEITDSTADVVKTYEYKTFGTISKVTGTLENPYTYTSREYDAETGLYYYRARYYNPMQGRFINKDPIGINDGPNRFIYVGNNPVNMVDPTGEVIFTAATLAIMYLYFEGACTAYDAGQVANTWRDPNSSKIDVIEKLGWLAVGIIALGPGSAYDDIAKGVNRGFGFIDNASSEFRYFTPTNNPGKFTKVRGRKGVIWKNITTKKYFVKDTLHKNHYEVYNSINDLEKSTRSVSVWFDGRLKDVLKK